MYRRHVLGGLAGLAALGWLTGCRSNAVKADPARRPSTALGPSPRPRHMVLFFLRGGIDSILTTCPRQASEVDEHVDLPYSASEIFSVNGKSYGPHLRPLERHLGDMAIINGVYGGSVQHDYGAIQLLRMQTRTRADVPTIGEVIGRHLGLHPLATVAMGQGPQAAATGVGLHPPGELSCTSGGADRNLCDDVIDMTPEQLQLAAEGLESLAASPGVGADVDRNARGVAMFMRRLAAGVPKPRQEVWMPEVPMAVRAKHPLGMPMNTPSQHDCQRALWLMENELATCMTIHPRGVDWDTHVNNFTAQGTHSGAFFPVLARFLDELKVRKNAHGTLASQTLVVVTSELGRLPRLNDQEGKDHFPEFPSMLIGPRIKAHDADGPGAVTGQLGRRMEALPIDMKTGKASATGFRPTLNDLGASVLALFGIEPRAYGYRGTPLDFLVEV